MVTVTANQAVQSLLSGIEDEAKIVDDTGLFSTHG